MNSRISQIRQIITTTMSQWMLLGFLLVAAISNCPDVYAGVYVKRYDASSSTCQVHESSELLISLTAETLASEFAADHGLTVKYNLKSDPNTYVFAASSATAANNLVAQGLQDTRATATYLNAVSNNVLFGFVPNDPLFAPTGSLGGQWSLVNQISTGIDANVQGAWNRGITGQGITIGIVDDCLQSTHPDLQPNYSANDSYNFGSYVSSGSASDPGPVNSDDRHGTSVAGVAAARGGNGIGITGAAPYASCAGLRVDFDNQTTAQFVDATLYHSSGSNTTIKVENHSYGVTTPFVKDSGTIAERTALNTSTLAGTIHCFAAGNNRTGTGCDANKMYLQSSPDSITVAAVGSNGIYAYYSSYGANVFVSAPSSGSTYGVTTTDIVGSQGYNAGSSSSDYSDSSYTSTFGGTSAATPLVTGVLAMVKQIQPNLDTRFAKHLLALTSQKVNAADSTVTGGGDGTTAGSAWITNAAGYSFNENYGFGMIDADRLTQTAVCYSGVTTLTTASSGTVTVGVIIPDNDTVSITSTAAISATTPLEEVLVTLKITHTYRGDLEAWLTSPSGTANRLFDSANDSGANISWQFVSNAFWGENPNGIWSLTVKDVADVDTGTWNSWALDVRMGELIPVSEPGTAITAVIALGLLLSWWFRHR